MSVSPPFDAEARYRRLLEVLEGPVSDRWAMLRLDRFLAQLDVETPRAESYLLSLAGPLAERAAQLDPVGLHPAQLRNLVDRVQRARKARPVLQKSEAVEQAERHLRRRTALLYGYAGAVEQAVTCLLPSETSTVRIPEVEGSPKDRLQAVLEGTSRARIESALEWMRDHWDRSRSEGDCVPVVERLPSWVRSTRGGEFRVGGLRGLVVQLYGAAESRDQIQARGPYEGPSMTEGPVKAARQLLDEQFPGLRGRFVNGRVDFDQSGIRHEGQSAGLAIATLFYGAVLDHTNRRVRARVRPGVLLTGQVAPNGSVNSVEETSLPVKVQTAFFSPKRRLAVPATQRSDARAARNELLEEFPNGQLDIVGVERVEEVVHDRRLTDQTQVGRIRHTATRLWEKRGKVTSAALVLGVVVVIGALVYGPFDQDPASAQFRGSTLLVENEIGRVLEELEVGRGLVRKVEKGKAKSPVAFADVTGGGTRELFWGVSQGDRTRMDVLRAKAIGADTLLWERPLRFEVDFPDKPEATSPTFGIADLTAEDLNQDGDPELYALANHRPYFPSLLLQLRPSDGTVRQRYVHPGHLRSGIETADLVGGPALELLVGGHSNAFQDPVLSVLRPSDMAGHAPTHGDYGVGGTGPASQVAYLRFPSTPLQKQWPATYPMVWSIRSSSATKTLEVVTQDGQVVGEGAERPKVISTLDYDLRPQAIGTDGVYDRLADSLAQRGVLETVPGPKALRRYGEGIWYWTGRGWSSEPTFVHRPDGQ